MTQHAHAAHAQNEKVLYTGEIFSKIFVKKRRNIGDLIYDHGLTNYRFGANLKMVNFQKWDFFRFFIILLL